MPVFGLPSARYAANPAGPVHSTVMPHFAADPGPAADASRAIHAHTRPRHDQDHRHHEQHGNEFHTHPHELVPQKHTWNKYGLL